jgi:hypothetical protein
MILLASLAATAIAAHGDWKVLARCAAAYEVNAQVSDPERPATMKAMVSDVAADYRRAAEARYRKAMKASSAMAHKAVGQEVAQRVAAFRRKPRTDVEAVIDACPQPE